MSENWLQEIISQSVKNRWCAHTNCTTCGSHELREAFVDGLQQNGGIAQNGRMTLEGGRDVILALRECSPSDDHRWQYEEVVRWILYQLWLQLGEATEEAALFPHLSGSWTGNVLVGMQEHYASVRRNRELHNARQGVKKRDWAKLGIDK